VNKLLFGYNTNGFAHHRVEDALIILYRLGYSSAALTLDYHSLNPFDRVALRQQLPRVRRMLKPLLRGATIETGARFLLDPHQKHQPTLLSKSFKLRSQRIDFLRRAIDIAVQLDIGVVSLWSGAALIDEKPDMLMKRLADGCRKLAEVAERQGVRLAFEPEPGMFINTMAKFTELFDRVVHPAFGLTIDIGHLHCQGETPIEAHLRQWKDILWNVHIDDMKRGVHDHVMFGDGEIAFPPVLRTLSEIGYSGGVHVELSRHSHDAVETARKALVFLQKSAQLA
jgi:L-ribulose-5-phosphate 3-epimerase